MEETEKRNLVDLYNYLVAEKHKYRKAIEGTDIALEKIREALGISLDVSFIEEV